MKKDVQIIVTTYKLKCKVIITMSKKSQPSIKKVKGSPSKKRIPTEIPKKITSKKPKRKMIVE